MRDEYETDRVVFGGRYLYSNRCTYIIFSSISKYRKGVEEFEFWEIRLLSEITLMIGYFYLGICIKGVIICSFLYFEKARDQEYGLPSNMILCFNYCTQQAVL